ncbi:hypothetical protein COCNU_02G019010 [Cocos nucifera]|uniref:Uncharacterized protein n=1 Tax=Cocos nucifera TaxID=13894 RepID=A0A8K0I1W4_COCNU|nr:hypothetical protein COCNU_02G019010 [Cocos nucifera]
MNGQSFNPQNQAYVKWVQSSVTKTKTNKKNASPQPVCSRFFDEIRNWLPKVIAGGINGSRGGSRW